MLAAVVSPSIAAQPVQRQPVVELALRERLQQAVTGAQAALAAVDVKKVTVESASSRTHRTRQADGRARRST